MYIITKKVRLVAAPEPVVSGSSLLLRVPDDPPVYKFFRGVRAVSSPVATVDWGDGVIEEVPSLTDRTHAYAAPGDYLVRFSDDFRSIRPSGMGAVGSHYLLQVRAFASSAAKLTELSTGCFRFCANLTSVDVAAAGIVKLGASAFEGCTALTGCVALPKVTTVEGDEEGLPFEGCDALEEIRFSAVYEAEIKASAAYRASPSLGASNATVIFSL